MYIYNAKRFNIQYNLYGYIIFTDHCCNIINIYDMCEWQNYTPCIWENCLLYKTYLTFIINTGLH